MKSLAKFIVPAIVTTFLGATALAGMALPPQPTDPQDPGSSYLPLQAFEKTLVNEGRHIEFFAPTSSPTGKKLPVIVFGHGHDVPMIAYKTTLDFLARKGIAVIYPDYSAGAANGDFVAYAQNYMKDTAYVLSQFPNQLDPSMVIFSGHSNGARVALTAAGLPASSTPLKPRALLLFETAGFDNGAITQIDPRTVVTMVVGDRDTNTPPAFNKKIYDMINVTHKQFIQLSSYLQTTPNVIADHGAIRTIQITGQTVTPLHYYGFWKFLVGAAWDLEQGGNLTNPYIYGPLAATTGIPGFSHQVFRGGTAAAAY